MRANIKSVASAFLCLLSIFCFNSFSDVIERESIDATDSLWGEKELVKTDEIPSARGERTRIWENTYRIPLLDKDTLEPTGKFITETKKYFEKGDGICYNTAPK